MKKIMESSFNIVRNSKIQMRLIISFLLVSSVPLLFLGIISYNQFKSAINDKISTYTGEVMNGVNNYIEQEIKKYGNLCDQLSFSKETQDHLTRMSSGDEIENQLAVQKLWQSVEAWSMNIDGLEAVIFHVTDGATFVTGAGRFSDPDSTFKELYSSAEKGNGGMEWTALKNKDEGTNIGKFTFTIYRGIKCKSTGEIAATLIMQINQQHFSDIFKNINLGEGAKRFMLASDGTVLASAEKDMIPRTKYNDIGIFKKMENKPERENKVFNHSIDNSSYLVAYSYVNELDAFNLVAVPYRYLNKESNSIRNSTMIIIIVCLLLSMLLSFIISRSISNPLKTLVGAIKGAREGNMTIEVNNGSKDEIGNVANNFNEMLSNIRILLHKVSKSSNIVLGNSKDISDSAERTYVTSGQVAAAMQQISQGATEQAGFSAEAVGFIERFSTNINDFGENMADISRVLSFARRQSSDALDTVKILNEKALRVNDVSGKTVGDINELNKEMKKIKNIVKVMVDISEQTNLLSLNATIEAARAGELGKGFAVVASEVKKLADRSKESSIMINDIVGNIQQKAEKTVEVANLSQIYINEQMEAVQKTDDAFKSIYSSMESVAVRIGSIAKAIDKILHEKEEVVKSISAISALSEQTASATEEISASTEEQMSASDQLANMAKDLNQMALELNEAIALFKVDK